MRLRGLVFRALGSNLIRSARAAPVGPSLVVLTLLVAAVPAAAQSYTVLYSFPVAQPQPSGLVQASDGNFYGTTYQGGASGLGSVIKITPAGVLTTLYSFVGSDGKYPKAGLVQSTDGNLYGTTYQGGSCTFGIDTIECGTVFKITPAGVLTTLHNFASYNEGANPSAALVQGTDGNFYGTTYQGGAHSVGTVFKMTPAGVLTTLHSFAGSATGRNPTSALVQGTDGNFYGTTISGGADYAGNVFKMTPAGVVTSLHSFNGGDGIFPIAGLVLGPDGNFYGTTRGGSGGNGTVFKITPAGALTTLHLFGGSDGKDPEAAMVLGTDGNFYGTTNQGGVSGKGTVFKITPAGVLTTLHSFAGSDGAKPTSALVQGTDGNFYGTTPYGGASGYGIVFKISPSGTLTTLYAFAGSDGANPNAALVQGTDGNFYGTTPYGGASGYGTVFKITPAGTLTTLYAFAGSDGANPFGALVQGTDGNFYGTTPYSGAVALGSVFKITPAGTLMTLHLFGGSGEGNWPFAGLVQATDGNFYGTTSRGGGTYPNDYGTVFKITPAGMLTTLYAFAGSDGKYPYAGLVQGTDGNSYGTTYSGGAKGGGTVFKITPAGALTTLHNFGDSDGIYPYAGLVQGTDGNFYGTTLNGGSPSNYGMVFKITPAGALTMLHSFTGSDGSNPYAGLVQGTDGSFYGMASQGGLYSGGVVFRLTLGGAGYYTLSPCRVADTRDPPGVSGGPALAANTVRSFPISGICGIPATATAVAINVAVVVPSDDGDLRVYPAGSAAPPASSINFRPGIIRANNAVIPLGAGGQISIQCDMPPGSPGSTNVFLDVYGYFQ